MRIDGNNYVCGMKFISLVNQPHSKLVQYKCSFVNWWLMHAFVVRNLLWIIKSFEHCCYDVSRFECLRSSITKRLKDSANPSLGGLRHAFYFNGISWRPLECL